MMKNLVTMALMAATAVAAAQGMPLAEEASMCVSIGPGKVLCTTTFVKRMAGETTLVFEDARRVQQGLRGAGEASAKTADLSRPVRTSEGRKSAYVTGEDWCKDNKR